GRRLGPRTAVGEHMGLSVVFVAVPAWRPKRLFWPVNRRREQAAMVAAVSAGGSVVGPIDLIHSHFYAASGAVPAVAAAIGVPYVHTEHTSQLIDPAQRLSRAGLGAMRAVFGGASRVFFVSDDQVAAVRRLGIQGRFEVVPNPVDPELFDSPSSHRDGSRLVTVGKLRPLKRHDLLLRALAVLAPSRPEVHLEIIGSGPLDTSLRALADELGIADKVTFWGRLPREEVADRLRSADVYVHAADRETFGVAIVEALFTGLPVVARAAGGVTTDLRRGGAAIVDGEDPGALAAAVAGVLQDGGRRSRAAAARLARERYSVAGVAATVARVYGEVAGGG
ncbi:MAG: glycosyltransferase, partial [Acidimicrobiia bacterium]